MAAVVHDPAHTWHGAIARGLLLVLASETDHRQACELFDLRARRNVRRPRNIDREVLPMKLEARVLAQADQADRAHARTQLLRPAIHDERRPVRPPRVAED